MSYRELPIKAIEFIVALSVSYRTNERTNRTNKQNKQTERTSAIIDSYNTTGGTPVRQPQP
jgi:hypothetical protein